MWLLILLVPALFTLTPWYKAEKARLDERNRRALESEIVPGEYYLPASGELIILPDGRLGRVVALPDGSFTVQPVTEDILAPYLSDQ